MKLDRKLFFDALRASSLNGGRLSQETVDCAGALLDAIEKIGLDNAEHAAVIFGQCHHESGDRLASIKETVFPSHKDQNPSDATVISRLDSAFRRGVMVWVKTPYWRPDAQGKSWFGRGMIQLTHKRNYELLGRVIGADLVSNPDAALTPRNAAKVAVYGCVQGLFTGRSLADCRTRADYRRVVNGDHKDARLQAKLSRYYDEYERVIRKAIKK